VSETPTALKPQDVLVACRLCVGGPATQAVLADRLRMSGSTVWKARRRLRQAGFFAGAAEDAGIDPRRLFDLLARGVPMFYPARKTGLVRGVPTGIYSPLFRDRFAGTGAGAGADAGVATVWPYGRGKEVGEGLVPLYPSVPSACVLDLALYEVMAAAEVLRVGRARERAAAEKYLRERLGVEGDESTDEQEEVA
jgi:DNA-binding Lrp family transcriptional regulator